MAMVKTRRKRDGKMERAGKRNGKKEKKKENKTPFKSKQDVLLDDTYLT